MKKKTIFFLISYISIIQPMDLDPLKSFTKQVEVTFTDFISSKPPEFAPPKRVIAFSYFLHLKLEEAVTNSQEQRKIKKIPIKKEKKKKYKIQKSFVCKGIYCKQSFTSIYRLKKHFKKKHPEFLSLIESYYKNLRPYTCTECTWAFNDPSHLKSHQEKTHSQAKPYLCKHCKKAYKHTGTRNKHEKNCTG